MVKVALQFFFRKPDSVKTVGNSVGHLETYDKFCCGPIVYCKVALILLDIMQVDSNVAVVATGPGYHDNLSSRLLGIIANAGVKLSLLHIPYRKAGKGALSERRFVLNGRVAESREPSKDGRVAELNVGAVVNHFLGDSAFGKIQAKLFHLKLVEKVWIVQIEVGVLAKG